MGQGELDKPMADLATRMCAKYGGLGIYSLTTGNSYDPLTDETTLGITINIDVDPSPPFPYTIKEIDGTSIKREDLWTIVPREQITEEPPIDSTATLSVNGKVYEIISLKPLVSGKLTAAWMIQLRP